MSKYSKKEIKKRRSFFIKESNRKYFEKPSPNFEKMKNKITMHDRMQNKLPLNGDGNINYKKLLEFREQNKYGITQ